jgi:hypothetical protein
MVAAQQESYLLLMLAQLVLLGPYVGLDVVFELLSSQLDAAGQDVQLLFLKARDLGQARVDVKHGHGLACCVSLLIGRINRFGYAPGGFVGSGSYICRKLSRHLSTVSRTHGGGDMQRRLRLSECPYLGFGSDAFGRKRIGRGISRGRLYRASSVNLT